MLHTNRHRWYNIIIETYPSEIIKYNIIRCKIMKKLTPVFSSRLQQFYLQCSQKKGHLSFFVNEIVLLLKSVDEIIEMSYSGD